MNKYMLLIGVMLIHVSFGTTFTVDGSNIRASISNRDYNRISFKDGKINQAFFKFLSKVLEYTHLTALIDTLSQAEIDPEYEGFVLWEISQYDAENLLGQLSFEANHCRNSTKAMRINDIADSVENAIYMCKRRANRGSVNT